MNGPWLALSRMPPPTRFAVLGGLAFGAAGGVVGLIVGLQVYAPTAWAAMFEVGLPAAFVGAVVGMVVGFMADGDRR